MNAAKILRLPRWSPRDWRAMIALWASIVGASVLTLYSAWLVHEVRAMAEADPALMRPALSVLARANYGLLVVIGAVLLSLGLAINRRSVKASAFGASFEAGGGAVHPDEDHA